MAKTDSFTNIQHVYDALRACIRYVSTHPEEFVYDPSRQFVRNGTDHLPFADVFTAPYYFSEDSIEVFGESVSITPFLEPAFCKKRQMILPFAYVYVFNMLNRSARRFFTSHGKYILGVDGSDQTVYGTACKRVKRLAGILNSMMSDDRTCEPDSQTLVSVLEEIKKLYRADHIDTSKLADETRRLKKLKTITHEDLQVLTAVVSELNKEAQKKQDPFLISHKNGTTRRAVHINALYDLMNRVFLDFVLQPGAAVNEDAALIELVRRIHLDPADCIITADRGYDSFMTFFLLNQERVSFVIRIKDSGRSGKSRKTFLDELDLPDKGEYSKQVKMRLLKDSKAAVHKKNGYDGIIRKIVKSAQFPEFQDRDYLDVEFRVVRFRVESGNGKVSYQTVATNLPEDEYPIDVIKEIYHLRWQLEEGFNFLKNNLNLKKLHSRKMDTITQELYAKATINNLSSFTRNEIEKEEGLGSFSVDGDSGSMASEPAALLEYTPPAEDKKALAGSRQENHEAQEENNSCFTAEEEEEPAALLKYTPAAGDKKTSADNSQKDHEAQKENNSRFAAEEEESSVNKTDQFLERQIQEEADRAKAVEYGWEISVSGVIRLDVNIYPERIVPVNGNKYAYALNFGVVIGLVKRYVLSGNSNAARLIWKRAVHHKVPIIPGRPDTREKYRGRKIDKARGINAHPESMIAA